MRENLRFGWRFGEAKTRVLSVEAGEPRLCLRGGENKVLNAEEVERRG